MKTRDPGNRVRPGFVILLACVAVAVLIPAWRVTRSIWTSRTPGSDPAAAEVGTGTPRQIPSLWQRVIAAPRGTAVSKRALTQKPARLPPLPRNPKSLEERWGIRICGARLSMGNAFLDVRYEVVNLDKADLLAAGNMPAYVLDRATGTKLFMLPPPKEGGFPPSGNRLATGRTYSALVSNQRGVLRSGNKVSVVVGDSLASDVTID